MTYRYRDSGIPKTIFAVPLGNVGEERQSVAFVVGACHLEYDGTTLSQRQFWDGLSLRNRRSLSSALTALGMMGEAIESGLREKAAIVAAKKTANEKFVDATVRTFSIITHETKSLFLKHFLDLRNRLEVEARTNDLAEEVCYAWDRMAASTSVAYLFSKVVSVGNAESASEDYELAITQIHSHFLEPLARMFIQGRLETALRFVAANVLAREIDNATVRVFPFCEQPKDQSVSECNLSPEEFSHCYMLITEPLRNFLNYGRDCEAEWDLDVSRSGIVATLNQQQNSGSYGLPVSQTFRSLGEFLKVVNGCEARSDEIEVRGRPGFSWRVVIAGAAWKQALRKVEEEQANFEKN